MRLTTFTLRLKLWWTNVGTSVTVVSNQQKFLVLKIIFGKECDRRVRERKIVICFSNSKKNFFFVF